MIDLSNILSQRENDHLEAKSGKGGFPDSFWETYSAFANTDGGTILLGVEERPDHTLCLKDGLNDAEKMKNDLWNMVNNRQKVSHNILTSKMVYAARLEGKDILVVEVPRAERTVRPVFKGQDPVGEHSADGTRATIFVPSRKLAPFSAMRQRRPSTSLPSKKWP